MHEASSKFVDRIATEKLLTEKLNRVHHKPDDRWRKFDTKLNLDAVQEPKNFSVEEVNGRACLAFFSSIETGYAENDQVRCFFYSAEKVIGDVLFVHGLYEQNREIYNFLIAQLNRKGLNVHAMTLPFHYERQPVHSYFSGEYFFSGDAYRNVVAFKQAVLDLKSLYFQIKKSNDPVWLVGFSMGGGVCLTLAGLLPVDGLFVINPVCNIADLIWHSLLFSPVKNDLAAAGFDQQQIADLYREFEPLNVRKTSTPRERIVVGLGLYDQINDPKNYALLVRTWNLQHVIKYKAGHLNILRVPKLAQDIARFYLLDFSK